MKIPHIEKASADDIKKYQWTALKKLLVYVNEKSAFYKKHFETHHIDINDIQGVRDLSRIPTVSKKDLEQYGKAFWCASRQEIVEYVNTSGTESTALTIPLTENDLDRLAYNEMISLACAGGNADEIYQLTTTVDRRFMAGLAYVLGARRLGAGMVRVGPGLPQLQWSTMAEVQPSALIIVPSFLLKMIDYAEVQGIAYKNSSVRKAICIGEPVRNPNFSLNALGQRIKDKWDIALYSTYASTEMATAFTECEAGQGGHLHPELIIAEILDDEGRQVANGQPGELTITTLGIEGLPLVRFRTGDICILHTEVCTCGRTTPRLGPLLGRKHQIIKYKGTTCYPPVLFDVLDNMPHIIHYQIEVFSNEYNNDEVVVKYYASRALNSQDLISHFKTKARFTPQLQPMGEQEMMQMIYPGTSRKPVKFVDRRGKPEDGSRKSEEGS